MPSRWAAARKAAVGACGGCALRRYAPTAWPSPCLPATRVADDLVQQRAGLLGHAEAAGPERFVDVLRRGARQRDLEVVNDAGAVHRQRRDVAALHQIDQHRRHAGLDHMRADAPDDARPRARARRRSARTTRRMSAPARMAGSDVEPALNERAVRDRPREVLGPRLAPARGERIRAHAGEIELLVAEWHGRYGSSWHNLSPHKELERRPMVRLGPWPTEVHGLRVQDWSFAVTALRLQPTYCWRLTPLDVS